MIKHLERIFIAGIILLCVPFISVISCLADQDVKIGKYDGHLDRKLSSRIRVTGNKFVFDGRRIWISGVNTPWNKWNEFGHDFDKDWWNNHFQVLVKSGVNSVGVWITCDGWNSSPKIDEYGKISVPTDKFWEDVDVLFELAKQHKLYLMISLISFNHSKPGNHNSELWRKMYKSSAAKRSFVDNYVIPFVQRYKENPYLFAINVGCELEWVWELHGVEKNDVLDLVALVANAVHLNSEILVCLGLGAGVKYNSNHFQGNLFSDRNLGNLQTGAYVDFYNIHYYNWQKQWFGSPFETSPKGYDMNEKPSLLGEYPAKGTDSCGPYACLVQAYALGWQGVMVWTSNGVDDNGSIRDFGKAFKRFGTLRKKTVFPFK